MKVFTALISLSLVACLLTPALAQPEVEPVLDGLDNPCAVTVQPETGHLFVSDSGALRVVRLVDGKAEDVIVGFPKDVYGKGPKYDIGPLGLLFLSEDILVVGGGGLEDGEDLLRVYQVPAAGEEPIQADEMEASFEIGATENIQAEGNFYALAATEQGVFATCNGDDTKGWVARLQIKEEGELGPYERFIATKEATEVDAPVGATISPRGELVIGQMGEITIPQDSLLTFYNPKSGEMLLNLETGLFDITALAYSPSGQLYATDFAWMDAEQGGLFQLIATHDSGQQGVDANKTLSLDKPTAMVFADDALYVTVIGTAEEGSDEKPGKLLKITGEL